MTGDAPTARTGLALCHRVILDSVARWWFPARTRAVHQCLHGGRPCAARIQLPPTTPKRQDHGLQRHALVTNILDDISRRTLFLRRRPMKQSRHLVRVPNSDQNTIECRHLGGIDGHLDTHSFQTSHPCTCRSRTTTRGFIDETQGTSVLRGKWSGPKSRRFLGQHWTRKTVFRKRVTTVPSTSSQSPDMEGGLSVFVSFDLNSRKDALVLAMHGESCVSQAARKERTEISTKHLNSEDLTTTRQAKQTGVHNWVRSAVVEAASKNGIPTRNLTRKRWVLTKESVVQEFADPHLSHLRRESPTASRWVRNVSCGFAASALMHVHEGDVTAAFFSKGRHGIGASSAGRTGARAR